MMFSFLSMSEMVVGSHKECYQGKLEMKIAPHDVFIGHRLAVEDSLLLIPMAPHAHAGEGGFFRVRFQHAGGGALVSVTRNLNIGQTIGAIDCSITMESVHWSFVHVGLEFWVAGFQLVQVRSGMHAVAMGHSYLKRELGVTWARFTQVLSLRQFCIRWLF